MKKFLFATALVVGVLLVTKKEEDSAPTRVERKVAQQKTVKQEVRLRESAVKPAPVVEVHENFSDEESADVQGTLPRGMRYVPFVKATSTKVYQPSLGKALLTRNGTVFFRSSTRDSKFSHVVYDQRRDTFHPVAETIKVTGVSEEKRSELAAAFGEHYYHQETQTMFVESSPEQFHQHLEDLASVGVSPVIETIQAVHIPK